MFGVRGKERIVAKPVLHYGKWRIRWTESSGRRHSQVFSSFEDAEIALRRLELEQLEIKHGGIRPLPPHRRTLNELADHWLERRG